MALIGNGKAAKGGGFINTSKGGGALGNFKNWADNVWGNINGRNAEDAQKAAAKEAERVRRETVVKEYGARQQADDLSYASAMGGNVGGGSDTSGGTNVGSGTGPGLVGQTGAPGVIGSAPNQAAARDTIGANISSSGTF